MPHSTKRPESLRTRITAWVVTIALVVTISVTVFGEVEAWPLTAFHLFSGARTEHSSSLSLVAVAPDGTESPVRADDAHIFVRRTGHLYRLIPQKPPAEARAMADAWLRAAGMDPDDYVRVELQRTSRVLDPAGGPPSSVAERTTFTLDLHP